MKIGFPRALYYFDYYPFWAGFFYNLDIELVTSEPTHRGIMESGLKMAHDETCLPVKLLAGHINSLKDVDYIFLPRMVSVEEKTYLCPKFLGIPESVSAAVDGDIPVITVTINWREGQNQVLKALEAFGLKLGKGKAMIRNAFQEALKWQTMYGELRRSGEDFEESLDLCEKSFTILPRETSLKLAKTNQYKVCENREPRPGIALVGHAYLVNERYANLDLVNKLRANVDLKLIEETETKAVENSLKGLRKKMFWSQAKKILGAGYSYVDDETVDGVIYLSCFGCGMDSVSQDMLARRARKAHKPYMVITLDEHSGEAGLVTRIEAFVDMIVRRIENESNLSAYGKCLDNN
ncbi:MAG: acyl-CoA dehydratase activase-related protein [Desulfitobacteriaceae bacterium]|nr:acyl-CoA dehydratase activase-related protein [Clostridia bacterium]MDD4345508.1 acyl-CoA dehydratase activase-related protein [Desulfitobacteriaceae bacterium]MDD4400653.1 acyl-CoA dehydratase activase-related protein [Desulfitobacteriaceae bacterium]